MGLWPVEVRPVSVSACSARRGFTLVELVIVVVIIGIIAAVAVPRMSRGSEAAKASTTAANLALLQKAIDNFTAEHSGLTPAQNTDGSASIDFDRFAKLLLQRSDESGNPNESGYMGPYLSTFPTNPFTLCKRMRFDGTAAVQNCSWRYVSATATVYADHDGTGGLCKVGSHNTPVVVGGGGGGSGGGVDSGVGGSSGPKLEGVITPAELD
jgi:prepilin-type N-terminal cleavage/methylation domain-containing protein